MNRQNIIIIILGLCLIIISGLFVLERYKKIPKQYKINHELSSSDTTDSKNLHEQYSSFFNPAKKTIKVRFINLYSDGVWWPGTLDKILKEKYNVQYVKDNSYDLVIDGPHGHKSIENQNAIKFYYTSQPGAPDYEKYDLSIGSNYIEDERYIRVPYAYIDQWPGANFKGISIEYKRSARQGKCNPNKKYFGCFLATNDNLDNDGVKARIDLFHKLSSYKFILSGGTSLNNNTPNNSSKSRIVPIKETKEFLSQCKFVIAYENTSLVEGYITEKPFQAYFSGAIPIYNGHKSVIEDLNKNAIIYSEDFDSKDDLIEYIKTIDSDDELYCKIWNQNVINKKEQGFEEYYNRLRDKIYEVLDKKFNPM